MRFIKKITKTSLIAVTITLLSSCSDDEPTTYTEKLTDNPQSEVSSDKVVKKIESSTKTAITATSVQNEGPTWVTPKGWGEERKKGMVLVRFTIPSITHLRCYITSLRGNGGGLEPNIQRWLGQIGVPQIYGKDNMEKFLSKQEKFKIPDADVLVLDFTTFNSEISMIVAVVSYKDITLYVKLMGPKNDIIKHKAELISLTKSIKR